MVPLSSIALPWRCKRIIATSVLALLLGVGCYERAPRADEALTLTLYSGQHEQSANMLVADFQKRTGINVKVRSGEGPEIANQIAEEGAASPADVYFTENSPELMLLSEKGLLAPVDPKTLAEVPSQYNSPQGNWVGVLARENVLAYNTSLMKPDDLPKSVLDLAGPSYKGKVGIAPTDSDFLPLISAVAALKGQDAALAWLKGLEENAQTFDDDEGVVAAVDRGSVATGIINNYYWARLQQETGKANMHSAIQHFAGNDVGGLVNVSGAAVLKSSAHAMSAQQFLAYLVSEPAQTLLAQTDVTFEYPLRPGVQANAVLKPFDQLQPPAISISKLGDDAGAADLLRQAGLL
jgi:iron(III) transport system substrate-binding protein